MADLKTKLFTLAGVATMFAGMAHAQATLGTPVATTAFIRAEGTTELLPATTVPLNTAVAGSVTLTVYLSPSVAITSEVYGNSKTSEITATANTGGTVNGTVSGSTVTFSNIPTTAGTTSVVIANIRVNANSLPAANGVPTGISELIFLSGANATPASATLSNLAYVLNGLTYSIPTGNNPGAGIANLICNSVGAATAQFTINIAENFSNAFKTLAQESGTNVNAPATNGTRLAVTFANIPTGVSVYAPLTIGPGTNAPPVPALGTGVLTMITSPTSTGVGSAVTAVSGLNPNAPVAVGQVAIANGTGTAYYELTTATTAGILENFPLTVYYASKAAALSAPASASSVSISFAPIGSTTNFPNFAVGSSTTTLNSGSTYSACSTTLLFPFVTNQLGFDTGLAISNTSSDLLAKSGTASAAAAQSGTCTLNFFGNTAPAAVTTSTVTAGTTYAAAASTVAPGFQGYLIASCNFLYGHGFAYVVYNLTQNNGAAMGYLADVINNDRKSTVSAEAAVTTNNPEQ